MLNFHADAHIKDSCGKSPLDIAKNDIKSIFNNPLKTESEKSTRNSPLFQVFPEIDSIPSIPIESFVSLNLSPINNSFKALDTTSEKQSFRANTTIEPDAEKSQLDQSRIKTYSFGGSASNLMKWLESVKLEFLYDKLMSAGYDDIEQLTSQMLSSLPINEEMLESSGIKKPGHRKRLLAALNEESNSLRSVQRKLRTNSSSSLKCCSMATPVTYGLVSAPSLIE